MKRLELRCCQAGRIARGRDFGVGIPLAAAFRGAVGQPAAGALLLLLQLVELLQRGARCRRAASGSFLLPLLLLPQGRGQHRRQRLGLAPLMLRLLLQPNPPLLLLLLSPGRLALLSHQQAVPQRGGQRCRIGPWPRRPLLLLRRRLVLLLGPMMLLQCQRGSRVLAATAPTPQHFAELVKRAAPPLVLLPRWSPHPRRRRRLDPPTLPAPLSIRPGALLLSGGEARHWGVGCAAPLPPLHLLPMVDGKLRQASGSRRGRPRAQPAATAAALLQLIS